MNKICIVARNFETYFIKRLIAEVGQAKLVFANPWELTELPASDLYLVRTTGIYRNNQDLNLLARVKPELIVNPLAALMTFRNKPSQYEFFKKHQLPHLIWKSLQGMKAHELEAVFSELNIHQGVVKPYSGLGGWGVTAFHLEGCKIWWHGRLLEQDEEYLLQPFITADEYRVFFVAEKRWTLKRLPGPTLAANFASQGEAVVAGLPESASPIIERLIQLSGARYGAIDLFVGHDGVQILELNTSPGIEQLEQVTRTNIMLEIVKSFKINH